MRLSYSTPRAFGWPRGASPRRSLRSGVTRVVQATSVPLLILAGIALVPREVNAGSIYSVQNYPAVQNGYTVSGTITTDGSTGTETNTNFITSFHVTISYPAMDDYAPFVFQSGGSTTATIQGSLDVTPSSITLGPAPSGLSILDTSGLGEGSGINWSTTSYSASYSVIALLTGLTGGPGGAQSVPHPWDLTPSTITTIAVATTTTSSAVPEPSTLAMSGLAAVCGLAYGLVRRRQVQRRQGAGGKPQPTE